MSNALTVTTNYKPYQLVSFHDLPPKVMIDFDYIEDEDDMHTDRFVKYKGAWYDTLDAQEIRVSNDHDRPMGWAMYVATDHLFADWNAVVSETFFSGVLFKFINDDYDHVICGSYYS